jgi:hypothetical protein
MKLNKRRSNFKDLKTFSNKRGSSSPLSSDNGTLASQSLSLASRDLICLLNPKDKRICMLQGDPDQTFQSHSFISYRVFQRFRQAKFDNGGSILSSSQFSLLPQLPYKMKLAYKVVKIDSK